MTCIRDLHKKETSWNGYSVLHSAAPSPRIYFIISHTFFSFPVCVRFMDFFLGGGILMKLRAHSSC